MPLDWSKLKSFSSGYAKSFEELCYQIVSEEYKDEIEDGAILTSIDDSGGGDGVEFYLTFPTGEIFGWQAKFIGRLNKGGRKQQIKQSLQTSLKNHPDLTKWFFCSKSSFTQVEKTWYEEKLPGLQNNRERVIPVNSDVELLHWGRSELQNYLRKYPSIYNFFFSDKYLSNEWFSDRYKKDILTSQIIAKYESKIHIATDVDKQIQKMIGGIELANMLENEIEEQQVELYAKDYKQSYSKIFSDSLDDEYANIQEQCKKLLEGKSEIIEKGIIRLNELRELVLKKSEYLLKAKLVEFNKYTDSLWAFYKEYKNFTESELCDPIKHILQDESRSQLKSSKQENKGNYWDKFKDYTNQIFKKNKNKVEPDEHTLVMASGKIEKENKKRQEARNLLFNPLYSLKEYAIPSLEWCIETFDLLDHNELHISGEAGMGKTHVAFNIYEEVQNKNQPAIFIFAKELMTNQSLDIQLRNNLDIPIEWTFDEFLGALEIAAKSNKVKIPIIIDGLNESAYWDEVWVKGLEKFIISITKNYSHLIVITTYRTSYEEQLFPQNYFDHKNDKNWWKKRIHIQGFTNLTWDAIKKYFDYYKIKLVNRSDAIGEFTHPLYLKIFCEIKNSDRKETVKVSFQNEDLFEVFDQYIVESNRSISTLLKKLDNKYDREYTNSKLLNLAEYIWENNTRGIPRSENQFSNEELHIFESENLLIYRDWNRNNSQEEIQFTYDLFGGYYVSKFLINKYKLDKGKPVSIARLLLTTNKSPVIKFIKSKLFRNKLLNTKSQHPLFNDILRTFCILLIKSENVFLFDILNNNRAKTYSIESLFEINKKYIKKDEQKIKVFLQKEFLNSHSKKYYFDKLSILEFDSNHPINFNFWSDLIKRLSMVERDISWSEYIRNNSIYENQYFSNFINNFELKCKNGSKSSIANIHIEAKKTMWVLTTTIRKLRDEATRALYFYSRQYPEEFFDLLKYCIDINDPYVPERMLSVSYGIAMARNKEFNDVTFQNKWLPQYARYLFDNIFSKNAEHYNSHILARDYAKRTIDIAISIDDTILSEDEKTQITYPLKSYPHFKWRKLKEKDETLYRHGNAPINMDFGNYTIGHLVKNRRNYDSNHVDYRKVFSMIKWRIYNLGFSLDKFGEIDKQLASYRYDYQFKNTGRIDRYGKKYSWISFYEFVGYRGDLGLLPDWFDEKTYRISEVDIDPSFPIQLKTTNTFINQNNLDLLGESNLDVTQWIDGIENINTNNLKQVRTTFDSSGEHDWILLNAYIKQADGDNQTRDILVTINAALVNANDYDKVIQINASHKNYTFENIRDIESYYIYEGEIPWSDIMPSDYVSDVPIFYNKQVTIETKYKLKILNNGSEITADEKLEFDNRVNEFFVNDLIGDKSLYNKYLAKIGLVKKDDFLHSRTVTDKLYNEIKKDMAINSGYTFEELPVEEKKSHYDRTKIRVESTIFRNSWEDHHSEVNFDISTITPSKPICNKFNLFLKPQSSDLYDLNGNLVSTSFREGTKYNSRSTFTYIRKDYLDKYLKSIDKRILFFQWTQKRHFPGGIENLPHSNESKIVDFYSITSN